MMLIRNLLYFSDIQSALTVLLQRRADTLMDYVYMLKVPIDITKSAEEFSNWITDQVSNIHVL